MTDNELTYNLALSLTNGVGSVTARNLLARFGSAEAVFSAPLQELAAAGVSEAVRRSLADRKTVFERTRREMDFMEKTAVSPVFFSDEKYPFRLKECSDSPYLLYVKGDASALQALRFVSIVGTRKITDYGRTLCRKFIEDLAAKYPDTVIVSGLAYGVDICAHKAAVDCGLRTLAVFAHGMHMIYPSAHRGAADQILRSGGTFCTEYPSDVFPDKGNFVQRNRIVAGMADAVVVVESAEKGGALITAELALSYNRDVLAFPGRVGDEYSAGCNRLIKTNKAAMIENVADLEYVLGWESSRSEARQADLFAPLSLSGDEKAIFERLKTSDALHVNQLAAELHLPMSKLNPILIGMEFNGLIKCLPGNMYEVV